jgi:CRISPR-associated protein Cas8a1/Csx13
LIPEVSDLKQFAKSRPWMNPADSKQFRVASPSDAALQAQVRLWAAEKVEVADIPTCHAVLFRPTSWASQQKSRVETVVVNIRDVTQLKTFQHAMANLKPRLVTPVSPAAKSAAKKAVRKAPKKAAKSTDDSVKQFWSDSIVRPLIAGNLARGQPWYRNFTDLMTKIDPVSKKPKRLKLYYEKEGLKAMIEKVAWQDEGEGAVVRAVHEAMRCRLGAIADENKSNAAARKKRSQGEFDKWRLAFAGSKTIDQFRKALCDLVSRAGANKVLREHWEKVLPWLSDPSKWQLTRDLSLLALSSYSGKGVAEIVDPASDDDSDASAE